MLIGALMEDDVSLIMSKLMEKGYTEAQIKEKIRIKKESLMYDITTKGILSIIASEEGIALPGKEDLKINSLKEGMKDVNVLGRVSRKYSPKEFTRDDGSQGVVLNVIVSDKTGEIAVVFWDENAVKCSETVNRGDILKIIAGQVKGGMKGPQLYITSKSKIIINPEGIDESLLPDTSIVKSLKYERTRVAELNPGDKFKEIRGTIAKLYSVFFYDGCPTCLKKMDTSQKSFCKFCKLEVIPAKVVILDLGIDDSTGYIRASFFKDKAEKVLGVTADQIYQGVKSYLEKGFNLKNAGETYLSDNHYNLLGKEIVLTGNVAENEFIGSVFQAHNIFDIDLEEEIEMVLEAIGKEEMQ
ncbi:MAG: Replication factor A [Candidatus Methanofastidiosum methylothiophilum]|uniref:Replication factor A n=1 Tax=Candidatus Methanofastidiosum methylothiophilum TaxID=1705564 RepID=A0A150J8S9_9EURY|nr:MAG: Replication factor A [Candidatus Methanofastidiosum methylthiophilus]